MSEREISLLVTFGSAIQAMAAEDELLAGGVKGRLIPTPVQISAGCGLSFLAPRSEKEALLKLLEGRYEQVYDDFHW